MHILAMAAFIIVMTHSEGVALSAIYRFGILLMLVSVGLICMGTMVIDSVYKGRYTEEAMFPISSLIIQVITFRKLMQLIRWVISAIMVVILLSDGSGLLLSAGALVFITAAYASTCLRITYMSSVRNTQKLYENK